MVGKVQYIKTFLAHTGMVCKMVNCDVQYVICSKYQYHAWPLEQSFNWWQKLLLVSSVQCHKLWQTTLCTKFTFDPRWGNKLMLWFKIIQLSEEGGPVFAWPWGEVDNLVLKQKGRRWHGTIRLLVPGGKSHGSLPWINIIAPAICQFITPSHSFNTHRG